MERGQQNRNAMNPLGYGCALSRQGLIRSERFVGDRPCGSGFWAGEWINCCCCEHLVAIVICYCRRFPCCSRSFLVAAAKRAGAEGHGLLGHQSSKWPCRPIITQEFSLMKSSIRFGAVFANEAWYSYYGLNPCWTRLLITLVAFDICVCTRVWQGW